MTKTNNDDDTNEDIPPTQPPPDGPSSSSDSIVLRVAVGTENPCKIDAVRQALVKALGFSTALDVDLEVQGFAVSSDVPDQPFGDVSASTVCCSLVCRWCVVLIFEDLFEDSYDFCFRIHSIGFFAYYRKRHRREPRIEPRMPIVPTVKRMGHFHTWLWDWKVDWNGRQPL